MTEPVYQLIPDNGSGEALCLVLAEIVARIITDEINHLHPCK